jgi:mRNA-degrading endonuclease RelE of RelBE toxin-antitoxin system
MRGRNGACIINLYLYPLSGEATMRRVVRTKKYVKSLRALPERDRRMVESEVDLLEGDWKGLDFMPIKGQPGLWRLRAGDYRVLCEVGNNGEIQLISALMVKRRTSTTYH